jgi:MFS family permease
VTSASERISITRGGFAGWRWLPPGTTPDARRLLTARGLRAFGDGFVSVLLPVFLLGLGLDEFQIGAVATATLVGSAALTLLIGLVAHRYRVRPLLLSASVLMAATGVAFVLVHDFWPLLLVAFVGTLNPSSGDVSVFLPLEQSVLPRTTAAEQRTNLFARYSLIGSLVGAAGALFAAVPQAVATRTGFSTAQALQAIFVVYGFLGLVSLLVYRGLSPSLELPYEARAPLRESRRVVYALSTLFSLDAFGSGFVVQSLLALWLFQRFDLSVAAAGTIFFWTGVLSAGSYLVAARLAQRLGLINSMVFTHLPSNVLLLLVPFMPTLPLALAMLFARSALSQMDVPTRNSYVMAVVPPAERPAAASVTAVPRSLASAASPLLSGYLLGISTFGWPLVVAGLLKGTYDLLLLRMFARVKPPEEAA